jgi:hypothetical protein
MLGLSTRPWARPAPSWAWACASCRPLSHSRPPVSERARRGGCRAAVGGAGAGSPHADGDWRRGSRSRLTATDAARFRSDSVVDQLARLVCELNCIPRKVRAREGAPPARLRGCAGLSRPATIRAWGPEEQPPLTGARCFVFQELYEALEVGTRVHAHFGSAYPFVVDCWCEALPIHAPGGHCSAHAVCCHWTKTIGSHWTGTSRSVVLGPVATRCSAAL